MQSKTSVLINTAFDCSFALIKTTKQGRQNVFFICRGGGGAKTKIGTIMSKRALTMHMHIISLMC